MKLGGRILLLFTGTIKLESYSNQQWLMILSEKSHSYLERFKDLSVQSQTEQSKQTWRASESLSNRQYTPGSTATGHFATV
jgi:hypothetical protein